MIAKAGKQRGHRRRQSEIKRNHRAQSGGGCDARHAGFGQRIAEQSLNAAPLAPSAPPTTNASAARGKRISRAMTLAMPWRGKQSADEFARRKIRRAQKKRNRRERQRDQRQRGCDPDMRRECEPQIVSRCLFQCAVHTPRLMASPLAGYPATIGAPRPLDGRLRRQVSWLRGSNAFPAFPVSQWHSGLARRSQLRGQPRIWRTPPHRIPFSSRRPEGTVAAKSFSAGGAPSQARAPDCPIR